jgi:hypothetical protein
MDPAATHALLLEDLRELRAWLPHAPRLAHAVSGWSVGEHIHHLTLVDQRVIQRLRAPTPEDPGLAPAGPRALEVLASGTLPRGIAKAPAASLPTRSDPAGLAQDLAETEALMSSIAGELAAFGADPGIIRHGQFGGLTRTQWLRLMHVHHRHHLAIMADVRGAS